MPSGSYKQTRGTSRNLSENMEEDWSGLADPNRRRKLQNRLNQRAARLRRAATQNKQKAATARRRVAARPIQPKRAQDEADRAEQDHMILSGVIELFVLTPKSLIEHLHIEIPAFEDENARTVYLQGSWL
ncbi:hypothetical protein F5Y19DRAFT_185421 [Xylariaceae sp. FL1651]|nr:hypothetical protein F5Y19DRAFT_185421 [Xylariaceae sp. FL1651]